MNKEKITATDIKKALSKHHTSEFFITECKNGPTYSPSPQGLLKFDGLAIYKSWSQKHIRIYEIKVSRSDFLQDNKYHLYKQYCHEMYFAVPKGLVKKEEVPDDVGLMYYYPETGAFRTVKKALWRDIEISADMLMYIFMNKLDSDRIPFYSSKAEYAKEYIDNKNSNRDMGWKLGTVMAKKLDEMQQELNRYQKCKEELEMLNSIKEVMYKHGLHAYWGNLAQELDDALSRKRPKELDNIERNVRIVLKTIEDLKGVEDEKC